MSEAPRLLGLPEKKCPLVWTKPAPSRRRKQWDATAAVIPLERNLYGHPLAGLLWERGLEEVLFGNTSGKKEVFTSIEISSVLVRTCGPHQDDWHEGNVVPMWESCEKTSMWKIQLLR